MSDKQRQSATGVSINDKSQGSVKLRILGVAQPSMFSLIFLGIDFKFTKSLTPSVY